MMIQDKFISLEGKVAIITAPVRASALPSPSSTPSTAQRSQWSM